jgi:hypothetical protein
MLAVRYTRGTAIAAVLIAVSWHLVEDGLAVVTNWPIYRWPTASLLSWLLYAVLLAFNSVEVLRTGRVRYTWLTVVSSVAIAGFVAVDAYGQIGSFANWAWGAIGWLGVLACWGRSLTPLLVLACANLAVNGVVLFVVGSANRVAVTLLLMIAFGMYALQFGFMIGARALTAAASWAVEAAGARVETDALRVAGEEMHAVRRQRYEWLQRSAARVLGELASGTSDPVDPDVQRRCAIEAARLRRLFLETEDVPDPLLHEIRGCADVAERRGVIVDLRTVGRLPVVPVEVRRALVEPVIVALTYTSGRARVTLVASEDAVSVSVLAKIGPDVEIVYPIAPPSAGIGIQHHREEGALWVESRWHNRSPSP